MRALKKIGLLVIRFSVLIYLSLYCIVHLRLRNLRCLVQNIKNSKSQIFQDLMIIATSNNLERLHNFYFVEFGATNGISLSNTYMFEKVFHANGIVAEPARIWQSDLRSNRRCEISNECVWESSGKYLEFVEASNPDLSGLTGYENSNHEPSDSRKYQVKTISLLDLLQVNEAPKRIDFLSIDTEGSEFEILKSFDFQKYQFLTIVCEHNYGKNRASIKNLLESKGYKRRHKIVSFFDDWYFLEATHFE
ncbi:Methyltransferase FkbM [Candidatus Nanopelagicaceae bacterium]